MEDKKVPEKYGLKWNRDELILAFDLYCRTPFKKTKANNPQIIELSKILKRSPAGVARKLGNFGSFDPELRKQKISGLAHSSKLDKEIWDLFHDNWNELILEAKRIKSIYGGPEESKKEFHEEYKQPLGPSEKETIQKTRIHQSFFRDAIFSSYEDTCCITGLRIRDCLVASHIVPWSKNDRIRTDPRNGLCLSATFDRLFDRGKFTVTKDLHIFLSSNLRENQDRKIKEIVGKFHGQPIIRPHRFLPLRNYLEWHNDNVFIDC